MAQTIPYNESECTAWRMEIFGSEITPPLAKSAGRFEVAGHPQEKLNTKKRLRTGKGRSLHQEYVLLRTWQLLPPFAGFPGVRPAGASVPRALPRAASACLPVAGQSPPRLEPDRPRPVPPSPFALALVP